MTEENLISAVCCRIQCDIDKIESNSLEKIEVESFNLSDFWTQFGASVQSLSNEVTKLGFMCGKKPFPNFTEVSSMLQDMMQYYNIMRDLYLVLPEEVGAVVYKGVRSAMLNILAAVLNIVRSLEDLSEKGAKERLTLTGTFWDACNAVESLPQDNLHATLKIIDEECSLAVDAQEELTTTIEEDHILSELKNINNSDLWSSAERDLSVKAVGLVKVTKVCLQKLQTAVKEFGSCSTTQQRVQLDHIANMVQTVSPALDNFVSELYHPVDFNKALENAGLLVDILRDLLFAIKGSHYEEGINSEVVNNLIYVINHNHMKLDPQAAVANPVPEFSKFNLKT